MGDLLHFIDNRKSVAAPDKLYNGGAMLRSAMPRRSVGVGSEHNTIRQRADLQSNRMEGFFYTVNNWKASEQTKDTVKKKKQLYIYIYIYIITKKEV